MKKFKRIAAFLTAAALIVACTACGGNSSSGESSSSGSESQASTEGSGKQIGIVFTSLNNPVFAFMKEKMEAKATELGYTPIVLDSQEKSDVELQNVENLISKKVDAICILPVSVDSAINAVSMANDAGIPVIGWNRVIDTQGKCEFVTQVVTDDRTGAIEAGKLATELLADTQDPKVVVLRGTPGMDVDRDRAEGFKEGLKENGLSEDCIVAEQAADFERQKGFTVMENIIQGNPEIDLVYAENDEMALGAMQALKAANMNDVMIVGFDGSEECVAEIANGNVTATIAQKFAELGTTAIECAAKAVEGDTEGIESVISVGTELVNSENAENYEFK